MRNRFSIGIILILISLMTSACGCIKNIPDEINNTVQKVSLSERQKSILEENGLPTEYNELLPSQKAAIVAIEEMLCYVEEKYDTSFSYAGYIAASPLEKEHMIAFPTSGNMASDSFTITKNGDTYEDEYINVVIIEGFTSYIYENIKAFIPDTEFMVFSKITKTSFLEVPPVDVVFDGKVESSLNVFIDGGSFEDDDLRNFNEQFAGFMKEHQLYGIAQIVLLKEGRLVYLTKYNFTDYLSEEHYTDRETLYIKKPN
jgi:hypothetical protein